MKKIRKRISKMFELLRLNLRRVAFDGIAFTILLTFFLLLVTSEVARVFQRGQANYAVYLYEVETLKDIRARNEFLKDELSIVETPEFGKLLARDVLGLAESGEQLYTTQEEIKFFEPETNLMDLSEQSTYQDWWVLLLR